MVSVAPYSLSFIVWASIASYVFWAILSLLLLAMQLQKERKVYIGLSVVAVGAVALFVVNGWLSVRIGELMFVLGMEVMGIIWIIVEMVRYGGEVGAVEEVDIQADWYAVREH